MPQKGNVFDCWILCEMLSIKLFLPFCLGLLYFNSNKERKCWFAFNDNDLENIKLDISLYKHKKVSFLLF